MSDDLSIAVVTATLQGMIQQALVHTVPGVTVRVGPPRAPAPGAGPEVNLYLFLLSPNESLRNNDLPTRNEDAVLRQRPSLAVNLHYVISFFGEQDLASERMAARIASYFHANPILTPDLIRSTISSTGSYRYLSSANLGNAPEPVRLNPYYPTLEELSKLWTVFFQMAHRISIQYTAGPVVVDFGPTPDAAQKPTDVRLSVRHRPMSPDPQDQEAPIKGSVKEENS